MTDNTEDSEDERAIELSTLAAIYPELEVDAADPYTASLEIPVEPLKPLIILFPTVGAAGAPTALPTPPASDEALGPKSVDRHGHAGSQTLNPGQVIAPVAQDTHLLSHLPPLSLRVSLPKGYPTEKPPLFRLQSLTPWIPEAKLQELRKAGYAIWEDMGRDHVVYSYLDHLREAADKGFGLASQEGESLEVSQDLKLALLDFDLKAKRAKFEAETFECGVCIEMKKGSRCHRLLLCGHVFCVECLQDYFNTCITEGDVGSVKCMAPKCDDHPSKEDATLDPSELLQIPLSHDQVQRYIKMKRKKKYDSDPSTIYCPRTWCQGPARTNDHKADQTSATSGINPPVPRKIYDPNDYSTIPPPADRLAICTDCNFAFCIVCKASWHGEYLHCLPRIVAELTAEERASEEYMKLHSTPCPTCQARCQKSMGCNHMICFKCDSHFCYLCSAWLMPHNPYDHFNDKKGGCYMRLWELEAGDGGEGVGIGFGGGLRGEGGFAPFGDESDDDDFSDTDDDSDSDSDSDSDDEIVEVREIALPNAPRARVVIPIRPARQQGRQR